MLTDALPQTNHDRLLRAINATCNSAQLQTVAKPACYAAHGAGQITDGELAALEIAAQGRQEAFDTRTAFHAPSPQKRAPGPSWWKRSPCHTGRRQPVSPDRQASAIRRRRVARDRPLPEDMACTWTEHRIAVLEVISREVVEKGRCALHVAHIAALAGVSASTVKRTVREAVGEGLLRSQERRRHGLPNLTTVLRIVCRKWTAWLGRSRRRRNVEGHRNDRGSARPTMEAHSYSNRIFEREEAPQMGIEVGWVAAGGG